MSNQLLENIYKILFNKKKKLVINSKLNDNLVFEKDINIKTLLDNLERKLTKIFFENNTYNDKHKSKLIKDYEDKFYYLYDNNKNDIINNDKIINKFMILEQLIQFKHYEFDKELLDLYLNIKELIKEYDNIILNDNLSLYLNDNEFDKKNLIKEYNNIIIYLNDNEFDKKVSKLNVDKKSELESLKNKCDKLIKTFGELIDKCIKSKDYNMYTDKINFLIDQMNDNKFW